MGPVRAPLAVSPGIVTDETSYATPGFFADGSNVRFRYGRVEPIGGWEAYHATPLSGVCRTALAWVDSIARMNVAFGTHTHLMVIKSGVLADITPAGMTAGVIDSEFFDGGWGNGGWGMGGWGIGQTEALARTWSLENWGENLMASYSGGPLYIWENDITQVATVVSQAPSSIKRMLVTPERQVLAFGCAEEVSNIYNPMCIRGSHTGDYTDWTTGSADNAFEIILEGGGIIIDAKLFGSFLLVWTDTSLFLGQYVGSADQAYRFDRIADNCGLAGPQAAVVFNQTAYWLTPDLQFYTYQYGGAPQPVRCTMSRDFMENLDTAQLAKVVAVSNSQFGEVWWFYPDGRDGDENSRYLCLNTADGSWSKGDVARTAAIDSGPLLYPLAVTYAGQTYLHDKGADADGSPLAWNWETTPQYLDEGQRALMIRGLWPDFEAQQGSVSLYLKTLQYPQATAVTKGPYTLTASLDKKDFRVTGRLVSVRVSASAAPTFARMGKLAFDAVPTGER